MRMNQRSIAARTLLALMLAAWPAVTGCSGEPVAEIHEVDPATGELRYLRPILVEPACLLCHGAEEELDPEVRRRLAERYPEDRATGFAEGDLRGAFSVRVRPAAG